MSLMWTISNHIWGISSCVAADFRLWDITSYRLVSLLGPEGDVTTILRKFGNYLQLTRRNIPKELNLQFVITLWKNGLRYCQRWAVRVTHCQHTVSEICARWEMAATCKSVDDYFCWMACVKSWSVQWAGMEGVQQLWILLCLPAKNRTVRKVGITVFHRGVVHTLALLGCRVAHVGSSVPTVLSYRVK
jgi:hypothetical protein